MNCLGGKGSMEFYIYSLCSSKWSVNIPFSIGFWCSLESLVHILVLVFSFQGIHDYYIIGVPTMHLFRTHNAFVFYVQYGAQQHVHQLKGILVWQFSLLETSREVDRRIIRDLKVHNASCLLVELAFITWD